MKKTLHRLFSAAVAAAMLAGMQLPVFAGTANPKMSFHRTASQAYYNLMDLNNGFQSDNANISISTVDGIGKICTAIAKDGKAPLLPHYWAFTRRTDAYYIAFNYRYEGEDSTSRMQYNLRNEFNQSDKYSIVKDITIKGDGKWRTGVFDMKDTVDGAASKYNIINNYLHRYFYNNAALNKTEFQAGNYYIFKNNPMITALNFDIAPQVGAAPATSIALGAQDNYSINYINWTDEDGASVSEFAGNKEYFAEISMTADENYTFADIEWQIPGASSVAVKSIDNFLYKNTLVLTAKFDTMGLNIESWDIDGGKQETNVIKPVMSIRFNKKYDMDTITASGAVTVIPPADFDIIKEDDYKIKLAFSGLLEPDTEYNVCFKDSIASTGGKYMEETTVSFVTQDKVPTPQIVSCTPENGAAYVARNAVVNVSYDIEMKASTISKENITVSPEVSYSVAAKEKGFEISFDDLLEYETEYTIHIKDAVTSVFGTPAEAADISFTTVPTVKNLVNNGFIDDHESLGMFSDAKGNIYLRYAEDNGKWVLKWSVPWDAAPVISKQTFAANHTYYISAKVKSDVDKTVYFDINHGDEGGSEYHARGENALSAGADWKTISITYTVPQSYYHKDNNESIRICAKTAGGTVSITEWQMYDMTAAAAGAGKLIASDPENGKTEMPLENVKMRLVFDKAMLPGTLNKNNITVNGDVIESVTPDRNLTDCRIVFKKLEPNKEYKVNITSSVKTMHNEAAEPAEVKFYTYTVPEAPMNIASTLPADNAENTAVKNLKMEAVFDTYPDSTTLQKENIIASDDIIKEVLFDTKEPKKVIIVFDDDKTESGKTYTVTFTDKILSLIGKPLCSTTVTFSTKSDAFMLEGYNTAAASGSSDLMKQYLSENFADLGAECDIFDSIISENNALYDRLCGELLGESVSTSKAIGAAVNKLAVYTIANYSSDNDELNALLESGSLNADAAVVAAYKAMSYKNNVIDAIKSTGFTKNDDIKKWIEEKVVLSVLKEANGWTQVQKILKDSKHLFPADCAIAALLANIDSLASPSSVYSKLQNIDKGSYREVCNELLAAYNANPPQYQPVGGGGGKSGSGGFVGSINPVSNVTEMVYKAFNDLGSVAWAEDAILELHEKGVISGREKGVFAPLDKVTREEFVKMLVSAVGIYDETAEVDFEDLSNDFWAYRYIASAVKAGVLSGIDENHFGTAKNITREDTAALIWRLIKEKAEEQSGDAARFEDIENAAGYARDAILGLKAAGIVSGDENNAFNPKEMLSRAEAAVILSKVMHMN